MAEYSVLSVEEDGIWDEHSESPMEALPEELILHVFQYLGPEDLLIRTPYVCKRWYRLSKDAFIWRNKELSYRMVKEDEFAICLLKAPELHKLDCSGLLPQCTAEKYLPSVQCPVSQLVLGDDMDPSMAVLLLERCLPHLDTLTVGRLQMKRQDYQGMMRAIDRGRLRSLIFSPRCLPLEPNDDHEFTACPPEKRTLRHLELSSEEDMPLAAVCRLIRAHCESLRSLSHEYPRPRPSEVQEQRVMEAVSTCRGIEALRVWSSQRLRLLEDCESLRNLALVCEGDCRADGSIGMGQACAEFFTTSSVLPRLRQLSLRHHECGSCDVMKLVAERCPELEVLTVCCSAVDRTLSAQLASLPRLHTLTLLGVHYMHPDMLHEWTETTVPALKRLVLVGTLRFCPWVCWASSVKDLRRRRPWLRVKLKECEHFQAKE